jgi:flagellar biosynthetic protein FliR
MFSYQGILTAIQQLLIGLMAGFVLQLVFAAVNFAGQSVAYSMGLGFASLIDPQTGVQVPAVSQLYAIVTTLAFLVMDGHMVVIQMLVDSFGTIPIAGEGFSGDEFWTLLAWSGRLFAGGLLLALPAVTALLFVNLALGVATRAAPQLNIFSVGFPVTLLLGLWLLWLTLPHLLDRFSGLLGEGYELTGKLLRL